MSDMLCVAFKLRVIDSWCSRFTCMNITHSCDFTTTAMSTSAIITVTRNRPSCQTATTVAAQPSSITTSDAWNEENKQNAVGETLRAVAYTLQQNKHRKMNTRYRATCIQPTR